jgi:hypothetical protein
MRKPPEKNQPSKMTVDTNVEDPSLLQLLVETLAECNPGFKNSYKKVQRGWRSIKTSTIQTRVSGNICFASKKNKNISYATCFVFTCTKQMKGKYDLTWSNSLS